MALNYEHVETLSIVVDVDILRYPDDEMGWTYDWRASSGAESDIWFETAEEAIADARSRF